MAMAMADQSQTNVEVEADSFGSLPDEIIGLIISLLPLREAFKASTVSRRWNKAFTNSMPNLNLNLDDGLRYGEKGSEFVSYCFMNMVERLLLLRTGFVDKVNIKCRQGRLIDTYRLNGWILYALGNKVRELDLNPDSLCEYPNGHHHQPSITYSYQLPIGIFTCNTLEVLRLTLAHPIILLKLPLSPPPNMLRHSCFPKLKCLHLSGLRLLLSEDDDSIASCSVLEELIVEWCYIKTTTTTTRRRGHKSRFNVFNTTLKRLTINSVEDMEKDEYIRVIKIEAPNLVYFKSRNQPSRFHLKNLNSLVQVHIDIEGDSSLSHPLLYYSALVDIFQGISHAQSLHLSGNVVKILSKGSTSSLSMIPKLPKLTHLTLLLKEEFLEVDFFDKWERLVSDLLACFPCLQTHRFEASLSLTNIWGIKVTMPSERPSFPAALWSRLKTVELWAFEGKDDKLRMAKYFLKNAQVLEKFTVYLIPKAHEMRSKITTTLLKLPKISKNCEILVL